jgi:hypothetical protein
LRRLIRYAAALVAATLLAPAAADAKRPPRPVRFTRIVIDPHPGPRTLEKALADINGDGRLDAVIGTGSGVRWYAFPASGRPTDHWVRHDILSSGDAYESMRIDDLNGDCRPDVILSIAQHVEWLQNPGGDGTGSWKVHPIANGIGHELALADIDGHGKLDLVTSRTRNIDFQNSPDSWTDVSWGSRAPGAPEDGLALLDIGNGKGAINIVAANKGEIFWLENPRDTGGDARDAGKWIYHRIGATDTGGPSIATMDVNGDGRTDVVIAPNEAEQGKEGLVWFEAPRDRRHGRWIRHTIDPTWQAVHHIEVGDFNRDGHPDLLLAEQEQSHDVYGHWHFDNDRVAILYGNGRGAFRTQVLERTGGQNQVAADIDGDGDLDFLSANHGVFGAPNPIELFVNDLRKPTARDRVRRVCRGRSGSG